MVPETLSAILSRSADPDAVLNDLNAARALLEGESDTWAFWLRVGTGAVVIGVVIELIAFLIELVHGPEEPDRYKAAPEPYIPPLKVRWWRRMDRASMLEFVGTLIVILGVAWELYADGRKSGVETALRKNNASTQAELTKKANEATASAVESARKVGGLDVVVKDTGDKVEALKATASAQKARAEALMADLTAKERELAATIETAQKTIEAAQEDEDTLRTSADTIKDLRQKIHDLTTHRVLSKQRIDSLTKAARLFVGTTFDMTIGRDSDSPDLAKQIGLALRDGALWDWKPTGGLGAVFFPGGLPSVGTTAFEPGVQFEICRADFDALSPAITAVYAELSPALLPATTSTGMLADKQQEDFFGCGTVHIIVGPKL